MTTSVACFDFRLSFMMLLLLKLNILDLLSFFYVSSKSYFYTCVQTFNCLPNLNQEYLRHMLSPRNYGLTGVEDQ